MIAMPPLAVAAPAVHAPAWTLAHARRVLADGDFVVTDAFQSDQPSYHLVFSLRQAAALRPSGHGTNGRWRTFTVDRWRQANAGINAYLVLKAFGGYRDCAAQPDAWHEYSGTRAEYELPSGASSIESAREWETPSGYGAYVDALHDGLP